MELTTQDNNEEDDKNNAELKKQKKKTKNINKRKGRVIIRNISFKVTDKKLRKHFEKYGEIEDVNILKRPDGKLVGCAFVQFTSAQNAAKAIYHTTGKPFLDRPIICDWALGKDSYLKHMLNAYKKDQEQANTIEIKDEIKEEIKEEKTSDDEAQETNTDVEENKSEIKDESHEEGDSEDDDDESEDSDELEEEEEEEPKEPVKKKPRIESNDVTEGKTVFIKNVPFSVTNEQLNECMSQFGPTFYALVCIDSNTEHSKGTGFVKFKNQEDAEKCLAAGTELTLKGTVLDCHKALNKNDLQNKSNKDNKKKDSRNLYLIKEGLILAGSRSAIGVSANDMARRLELERWKTQILRNLNMFISKYRLIIHNLPLSYDDKKLRELFLKNAGPGAVIKESRVMRDMKNLDSKGIGLSKGHGFITFMTHEHALEALRTLNNNPRIFTPAKRPIVAFSIENKAVMNARTKRLEKSKQHNPYAKEWDPQAVKLAKEKKEARNNARENNTNNPNNTNKQRRFNKKETKPEKNKNADPSANENFVGVSAKPGAVQKMRSRYKLKTQAQAHFQNLKAEKKKQKFKKRMSEQKQRESVKQPKQKQNKKKGALDDNFSKLVDSYKAKMMKTKNNAKSKWYEDAK